MPTEAARAALKLPGRELVTALAGPDIVQDGGYLRIFTRHAEDAGWAPAPAARSARSGQPDPSAQVGPATPTSPDASSSTGALTSPGASTTSTGPTATVGPGATTSAGGRLPPDIAAAVQTVLDDLASEPFAAPDTERLRALGLDAKALAAAARAGLLLRVADLVVLAPGAAEQAAELLAGLDQPFTTSQARQALRTSRRVAIPLLEYLDRARITERLPSDLRRLRDY
jgi:hypothetical protein